MGDVQLPRLSEEQRRQILEYERFIKELKETREPADKKSWLDKHGTGLVAILSIVLTATATLLTQRQADIRGQQLTFEADRRKQRREFVVDMHKLVAKALKATQDRLYLATGALNALTHDQRVAILRESNKVDDEWRLGAQLNGFLVPFHFSQPRVDSLWSIAGAATSTYYVCAESVYEKYYDKRDAPGTSCDAERDDANKRLSALWKAINESARH
jgi:hypothetical protein